MADFTLFTSLRYDPSLREACAKLDYAGWNSDNESSVYMLNLHRDRVLRAARHWQWDKAIEVLEGHAGLERLSEAVLKFVGPRQKIPQRVKVTVTKEGVISCEASAVPATRLMNLFPRQLPQPGADSDEASGLPSKGVVYEVFIDDARTHRSEYTHFKTSQRDHYDGARQRAGIKLGEAKEVLLVEADGGVMEGSTTTPYFFRKGRWVTPPVPPRFSRQDGSGGNDGTTRRWALERGIAVEEAVQASSIQDGEECWMSNGVRGFMFGRVS
ncbi:aminotransferase [Coniochaeta sp. 2T2.1]|nr:aminotransferase [Coniochaeta sp. 2T2.1]